MAYSRKRGKFYSARWRTSLNQQAERGGFLTKKEAEQFAEEQEALERRGKNTKPSDLNMTLRDFVIEVWAPSLEVERQTKVDYQNTYNAHLDPEFGNRIISSITPADINKWRTYLKENKASTGHKLKQEYIEKLTNQLGQILKSAIDNDIIYKNPMTKVRRKKPKKIKQIVPLSLSSVQALADGFAPRWKILIWLGFFTGMRPSEILGLTWDQLDFENEEINIDRQISRLNSQVWADYLKTPKSYRKIPFSRALQKMLLDHKDAFGLGPHNLILQNRSGEIWRYKDASAMFRVISRPLGLRKGEGIHQLRHTFASTCIMLNQNPKLIQEWLGHESILETMDTYGHLFPGELNSVRDSFDNYVNAIFEQPPKQKLLA